MRRAVGLPAPRAVRARLLSVNSRLEAQERILRLALGRGVRVSFGEGARAVDVAMVLLKGEREAVLALPPLIEEELGLHVHVARSAFVSAGASFELLLALSQPLEQQPLRAPERRAGLKSRLEEIDGRGGGEELLLTE